MQWLRQSWIGVLFAVAVLAFAFTDFGAPHEEPISTDQPDEFQNPDGTVADQPVPPYARTGWATAHADERNSRYVPTQLGVSFTEAWKALEDTPVLRAPVIGPEGHVYVTTGLRAGESNLHAYDLGGSLLWESQPWSARDVDEAGNYEAPYSEIGEDGETPEIEPEDVIGGPDSCALLQSPIVDESGDLYLSDCDQLWAYHADGSVKWVAELPVASAASDYQEGRDVPFNPFTVPVFTVDGSVLGVTANGQVAAFSRTTGESVMSVFNLAAPPTDDRGDRRRPPELWETISIDDDIIDPAWDVISGEAFPSTNTPAVGPDGTIYISASTEISSDGGLYAFEFDPTGGNSQPGIDGPPGRLNELWESSVGPGAISTPVVSHDGELVYLTDLSGGIWAVSSDRGALVWKTEGNSRSSSVTSGPNGHIYVLGDISEVDALDSTGEQLWTSNLEKIAKKNLPEIENLEGPSVNVRGQPTLTEDGLVVGVEVEYQYTEDDADEPVRLPVFSTSYLLDSDNGDVLRELAAQDGEPSGVVFGTLTGSMIFNHNCIFTGEVDSNSDVVGFVLAGLDLDPLVLGCGIELFRSMPAIGDS